MKHPDNRVISIPVHARKTIGKGLLLKILRDADLTKDELIKLTRQLLEVAKTGVEGAIETDEERAIAWMNQQLEILRIKLI